MGNARAIAYRPLETDGKIHRHSKRKINHASHIILAGSGQCHLDWRRLGRSRCSRYHCCSIAPLSLIEDDQGGYRLAVELHAQLPGIDRAQVQRIMDEAHKTCPYSKALRGDTSVKLVVDQPAEPARGRGNPFAAIVGDESKLTLTNYKLL